MRMTKPRDKCRRIHMLTCILATRCKCMEASPHPLTLECTKTRNTILVTMDTPIHHTCMDSLRMDTTIMDTMVSHVSIIRGLMDTANIHLNRATLIIMIKECNGCKSLSRIFRFVLWKQSLLVIRALNLLFLRFSYLPIFNSSQTVVFKNYSASFNSLLQLAECEFRMIAIDLSDPSFDYERMTRFQLGTSYFLKNSLQCLVSLNFPLLRSEMHPSDLLKHTLVSCYFNSYQAKYCDHEILSKTIFRIGVRRS